MCVRVCVCVCACVCVCVCVMILLFATCTCTFWSFWDRDWFRINPLEILLLGTNALISNDVAKRDVRQLCIGEEEDGDGGRWGGR